MTCDTACGGIGAFRCEVLKNPQTVWTVKKSWRGEGEPSKSLDVHRGHFRVSMLLDQSDLRTLTSEELPNRRPHPFSLYLQHWAIADLRKAEANGAGLN